MITLYARKEPTTDKIPTREILIDVVIYEDEQATKQKARYNWLCSNKPDRRNRYITLNCYKWRIVWLPDLVAA